MYVLNGLVRFFQSKSGWSSAQACPVATVTLLILAVLSVAGCGLGSGSSSDEGPARITVTRDFGNTKVASKAVPAPKESDTVLRALTRSFDVDTRYGGKFVQSIEGISGVRRSGNSKDWFYYVNGIEADRGASEIKVHSGDRIWWDYRQWKAAMSIPAVVGSFPEPFLHGIDGKRLPVRIECAMGSQKACSLAQKKLQAAGVSASTAAFGTSVGKDTLRLLVGPWSKLREDAVAVKLEQGPSASGVFVKMAPDGALTAFDESGREAYSCDVNCGLIAALGRRPTTWVVTASPSSVEGLIEKIAARLDRPSLTDRFAVLFSFIGPEPQLDSLPLRR